MRTLGERVERIEDIVEVTETKPDVALLESVGSVGEEPEVVEIKERLQPSDQKEGGKRQRSEEEAVSNGIMDEVPSLTTGKLKLKIKTEGGKRISKVVSEDKENIDLTVTKAKSTSNGGEGKTNSGAEESRVKIDSLALTPLSTSERAIDALRRQQNQTPSNATNSDIGSGNYKDEAELNSEVGCDLFFEPEETDLSDVVLPSEKEEEEKVIDSRHKTLPHNGVDLKKDSVADEAQQSEEKKQAAPVSPKKTMIQAKPLESVLTKRKSLRSQSVSSESDKSGLTNGHLEGLPVALEDISTVEDLYDFQDSELRDPDEFPDPDRSSWLKDSDKLSRCFRFKCPYCKFTDRTRHVVDDHIIIEHSIQGTSKMVPKYGEATKQQMLLLIERNPKLLTKYHEDLLFCEAPMSILEEVAENGENGKNDRCQDVINREPEVNSEVDAISLIQSADDEEEHVSCNESFNESPQESFNGSDVTTNDLLDDWMPCDATLPPGWQFKEVRFETFWLGVPSCLNS